MARQQMAASEEPPKVRRTSVNGHRWDEILAAAADEFHEHGYKAARLQDIARRVGLLPGSLYYYIDSKEDLLFALVEAAHSKGLAIIAEARSEAADPPERLRRFIERQLRLQWDSPSHAVAVVEQDRRYLSPSHRQQVDAMRRQLRGFVSDAIDEGIVEGSFDPGVDGGIATSSLFALLNSTRGWVRGEQEMTQVADWYVRMFLRGLGSSWDDPRPDASRPLSA